MILEDCPPDQAVRVAQELRQVAQNFCFVWDQRTYQLGISVGVAPLRASGTTPAEALSAADSACHAAKSRGRNRLH
jgi:diguanylate cyclase (GGDEF)-like protein